MWKNVFGVTNERMSKYMEFNAIWSSQVSVDMRRLTQKSISTYSYTIITTTPQRTHRESTTKTKTPSEESQSSLRPAAPPIVTTIPPQFGRTTCILPNCVLSPAPSDPNPINLLPSTSVSRPLTRTRPARSSNVSAASSSPLLATPLVRPRIRTSSIRSTVPINRVSAAPLVRRSAQACSSRKNGAKIQASTTQKKVAQACQRLTSVVPIPPQGRKKRTNWSTW